MGKRSKQNPGYAHQGFDNDRLFKASCDHIPGLDYQGCDMGHEVQRDPRDTTDPYIHYGTIAFISLRGEMSSSQSEILSIPSFCR